MLTESQNFITNPDGNIRANSDVYLYGKEINDETYAICKSDMMIKGNNPANIKSGSTLSYDEFAGTRFDFMLSNPPYGKSWTSEQKNIKEGGDVTDPRFQVSLKDYWGEEETVDAAPRSSDGQLLFLMEMVSKMKSLDTSPTGTRIASVHNGSSLFTGDAGSGESNIRRFIIENDLLEAIIQLPNNLFYNTGITTYIWLLSNNKPAHRQNKVQLLDASQLSRKLRKNLGNKNCEFSPEHVREITDTYLQLSSKKRNTDDSGIAAQVFDNSDFGYYKVNIERPDRRKAQFSSERIETLRFDKSLLGPMRWAYQQYGDAIYKADTLKAAEKTIIKWCEENDIEVNTKTRKKLFDPKLWQKHHLQVTTAHLLMAVIGTDETDDFNQFKANVDTALKSIIKEQNIKLASGDKNAILNAVSWYDENAVKVVKKKLKLTNDNIELMINQFGCQQNELADFGYFPVKEDSTNKFSEYITYETNADLRDSESVPLKDDIHRYFLAEVRPHIEEAWININSTKIGYEISFNKYFYQNKPLRSLEEVAKDIIGLEQQAEGLLAEILGITVENVSGVENA